VTPLNRTTRLPGTIRPALIAALAAAAIAAGALPAAAADQSYPYRVELANTAKKLHVRAGNVDWECRGRYCVAAARGGNVSVRGCRELASQVGRVVSYRSEIKHLEATQIEACNAVLADAASTTGSPAKSGSAAVAGQKPDAPAHVTTEELTFTGVHNWGPER
jgi:hypothetical protein